MKDIALAERNVAHRMIEEAMLAANVAVAQGLQEQEIDTLFRNHLEPDPDKMQDLVRYLNLFGIQMQGKSLDMGVLNKTLSEHQDPLQRQILQLLTLRSMYQAEYAPACLGHFGLQYSAYCHFTSPIRRYPDLITHRALRYLINPKDPKAMHYPFEDLETLGSDASAKERNAESASRDVVQNLKCHYMQDYIGEKFKGYISGVLEFGFFVSLEDIHVDGLVHVSSLKDEYYVYDSAQVALISRSGKKRFAFGDPVEVEVLTVNAVDRKIDFRLV